MTRRNAYRAYKTTRVETASPQQLILMLYQRAVASIEHAMAKPHDHRTELVRAQAIIGELTAALDPGPAPELCERLESLYGFVQHHIRLALAGEPCELDKAHDVLSTLLEGWQGAFATP